MSKEEKILFYDCKAEHGELSNFYKLRKKEADFVYEGKNYSTSEHYYQAKKFDYLDASEVSKRYAEVIRTAKTPNIAFCFANQVCNSPYPWAKAIRKTIKEYEDLGVSIDPGWNEKRDEVMYNAVLGKFQQNQRLKTLLINTYPKELVEHTHRDSYWADGGDGSGENKLGHTLMRVRDVLRNEVQPPLGKRHINKLTEPREEPQIKRTK